MPDVVHPAIRWTAKDQFGMLLVVTDTAWQIIHKDRKQNKSKKQEHHDIKCMFVPAKGSKVITEDFGK